MKRLYILILCLYAALNTDAQDYYRPSEALKNPTITEKLLIIPDKDDLMKISIESKKFTKIKTVKIRGGSSNRSMELANKLVSLLPNVEKLILESTEIIDYPSNAKLNPKIEQLELYENDMLETEKLFSDASDSKISKIIIDVFDLRDIPKTVKNLKNLKEIEVYDRNSVLFSQTNGYDLSDGEIKTSVYSVSTKTGNSVKFVYKSTQHFPTKTEFNYLLECFDGEEFINQSAAAIFEKKYINVKPPIQGITKEKEIFSVKSTKPQTIKTERDNYIFIPENAFVDKNGNPVSGNVDISYREFIDPIEIFMSGIPMKYDSAGIKYNFQSGGMFEITASVNGQEVFLTKNKKIEIDFSLVDTLSEYNTYFFDDKKGKWEIQNEPSSSLSSLIPRWNTNVEFSKGLKKFFELSAMEKALRLDTTRFEDRFESMNFRGNVPKKGIIQRIECYKNVYCDVTKQIQVIQNGNNNIGPVISIRHYIACNPELAFLRNLRVIVSDSIKYFNRKIKNCHFNDARIVENKKGYLLKLKNDSGIISLPIIIEKTGIEQKKSGTYVNYIMKNYNKMLEKRKHAHNRRISLFTNEIDAYEIYDKNEIVIAAYERSHPFMTPREKRMKFNDFLAYKDSMLLERNNDDSLRQDIVNMELIKSINKAQSVSNSGKLNKKQRVIVNTMGILNCDKIFEGTISIPLSMKFYQERMDSIQIGISAKSLCLIDKNNMIVYNVIPEEKIRVDGIGQYYLFGINEHGKLIWPKTRTFSGESLKAQKNKDLAAEILEKTPATLTEIKALLSKN